jgi:hypothetical protein
LECPDWSSRAAILYTFTSREAFQIKQQILQQAKNESTIAVRVLGSQWAGDAPERLFNPEVNRAISNRSLLENCQKHPSKLVLQDA